MIWNDIAYANMVGMQLDRYKVISDSPFKARFRCPFCGDSEKKQFKTRGYFIEGSKGVYSYCHNCLITMPLGGFIQSQDTRLFDEYKLSTLKDRWNKGPLLASQIKFKVPVFKKNTYYGEPLSSMKDGLVLEYATKRRIPAKFFGSLYSCQEFSLLTNQFEQYKNLAVSEKPILVIPFFNEKRDCGFINCRFINSQAAIRYLHLEVNGEIPRVWGVEFVDWSKPVYILEGAIDAMFIENALAIGGTGNRDSLDYILKQTNGNRPCFIYDFDLLYNEQVALQVKSKIDNGFPVFIPDRQVKGCKDINEVIINDIISTKDINDYIRSRIFHGLKAKLELTEQTKLLRM